MSWARADRLDAVLEDLGYGTAMYRSGPEAPIHAMWSAITMPVLCAAGDLAGVRVHPAGRVGGAVRGGGADGTGGGDRRESLHDHHHDDDSIAAIRAFLRPS
jgi:hypothetical protein